MQDAAATAAAARFGWLVLCAMMLSSRVVFQAWGPGGMRRFLDAWQGSVTHRVVGALFGASGVALAVAGGLAWPRLAGDRAVVASLAAVLVLDGLLNLVPGWFGHFKHRVQQAWVRRRGASESAGDRRLFALGNFALALGAMAVATALLLLRPVAWPTVVAAGVAGTAAMLALLAACLWEARRRPAAAPAGNPGPGQATDAPGPR